MSTVMTISVSRLPFRFLASCQKQSDVSADVTGMEIASIKSGLVKAALSNGSRDSSQCMYTHFLHLTDISGGLLQWGHYDGH